MTDAGQLDEIAITDGILGEHHQVISTLLLGLRVINRTIDDIHLIADDRLHTTALTKLEQLHSAVHHPVIGECQCRHSQLLGTLHHLRQLGCTIQQAVVAVVVKWNESHAPSLGACARCSAQ
ncbi:MAG: Uncharacterised protein [Cyanobium sp. ARS6]|nr:MAG: Uncharacterised protein [Cyanobium sp. ARS6]